MMRALSRRREGCAETREAVKFTVERGGEGTAPERWETSRCKQRLRLADYKIVQRLAHKNPFTRLQPPRRRILKIDENELAAISPFTQNKSEAVADVRRDGGDEHEPVPSAPIDSRNIELYLART